MGWEEEEEEENSVKREIRRAYCLNLFCDFFFISFFFFYPRFKSHRVLKACASVINSYVITESVLSLRKGSEKR